MHYGLRVPEFDPRSLTPLRSTRSENFTTMHHVAYKARSAGGRLRPLRSYYACSRLAVKLKVHTAERKYKM